MKSLLNDEQNALIKKHINILNLWWDSALTAVKLEMFGILLEHVFLAHVFMSYLSW